MEQKIIDDFVDFFCDVLLNTGHDSLDVANPHNFFNQVVPDDDFQHNDANGPIVTLESFSVVVGDFLTLEQGVWHNVIKLNSIWAVLNDSV